jgi:hypothetical protein
LKKSLGWKSLLKILNIQSNRHSGTGKVLVGDAGQPGEQMIRLLFDRLQDLRRIRIRFSEPNIERTQQFTLRWADSPTDPFREIVRQQSPSLEGVGAPNDASPKDTVKKGAGH